MFHNLVMAICASMIVQRTDRGDDMFMASVERSAQQAIDLESVDLLPAPGVGKPAPLKPDAADEGRHEPGPEPLWNESWYFDAVSDDQTLGVYVRLGRLPNQNVALYTACVCGPGRPSVMLVDPAAPLPAARRRRAADRNRDAARRAALRGAARAVHASPSKAPRPPTPTSRPRSAARPASRSRSSSTSRGARTGSRTPGASRRATRSRAA